MEFPISIIIPIYNEEKRIKNCLEHITNYCENQNWDYELIVVEDGSKDQSTNIVNEYSNKNNNVRLVSLPKRVGKGGSLLEAINHCRKPYVGFMDDDLAAHPSEFKRLIPLLKEFDLVIGSRILRGDLPPIKRPIHRSLLSHLYLVCFKCLFKIEVHDLQCGFKLFKRESIQKIVPYIKTGGFAFDTEFIIAGYKLGLKINEVPINWIHGNGSKVNIGKTAFEMSKDLLKIWYSNFNSQLCNVNFQENNFIARPIILSKLLYKLLYKYSPKNIAKTHLLDGNIQTK